MSVIAAKVYSDRIEIASDSIIIKDNMKSKDFKKVYNTSDVCAGGCGAAEELVLFFEFMKMNSPEHSTIFGILEYMKKFARWKFNYTNDDTVQNCYIIVYKNKLFEVDGMFVKEVEDYTAIGEGEAYALSALHLNHSVEEAVQVSCDLCYFVSEPVVKYTVFKK